MYIPSSQYEAAEFWCPFGAVDLIRRNPPGAVQARHEYPSCKGKCCACFVINPTNSAVGRCGLVQNHKY